MVALPMFNAAQPRDTKRQPLTLVERVSELADKEGMKEDDPLRLIFIEISREIDKFKPLIASYGPDTGRLAAEAAATVMRQEAGRLSNRMRVRTLAMMALGIALLSGGGVWAGWTMRGGIPAIVEGAAIPRDMAERFHHQNWPDQWASRRALPPSKDGIQWVMVPFLMELPPPK